MKRLSLSMTLAVLLALSAADLAAAKGRFDRGQALFRRHCAPCLSMGWTWAPSLTRAERRADLRKLSRTLPPHKVCTYQHRMTRSGVKGPACYPGRISQRDRLDILYYLHRRALGRLVAPRPVAVRPPPYRGGPLRRTLAARRRTALNRYKNLLLLRRMRARSAARLGRRPAAAARRAPRSRRGGR